MKLDENMKMHPDKFNFMYKSKQRIMNEDFISYNLIILILLNILFYKIIFFNLFLILIIKFHIFIA